jgi:hypothetical protein
MNALMTRSKRAAALAFSFVVGLAAMPLRADEVLWGFVKGAEPLPKGAQELYLTSTIREGKGVGSYKGTNYDVEYEIGATDRFTVGAALKAQSIKTRGIVIDAYIPKDESYGPRFSGGEAFLKYNFLSTAKDPIGLSLYASFDFTTLDPHSGQDKETASLEQRLIFQKYFLDGGIIWAANLGLESTVAKRFELEDLPPGFEWPTDPEMEIEPSFGTAVSWRFIPNWYVGGEAFYEEEHETEVGRERWSWFAGPSLHYGSRKWWATMAWMNQFKGGGEKFDGQPEHLHLIEKTKNEYRIKVGYNF